MKNGYKTQIASDLIRDGLGVELLDETDAVVAEVFRSDKENTLTVSTFSNNVPVSAIQHLLAIAFKRLGNFDDGTPLHSARSSE